jgi:hypothetical protein
VAAAPCPRGPRPRRRPAHADRLREGRPVLGTATARGITHSEAVAALEEAELQAHLDRRDEAAADDGGRCAEELAEWQRVVQLLAATGDPYDPDADIVVQEELPKTGVVRKPSSSAARSSSG